MKVTIQRSEKKKPKREYPYFGDFMGYGDFVVLFHGANSGTIIKSIKAHRIGEYKTTWSEKDYTPITDPILIEP